MKIDAFCHVMPREYAERLEAVDDAPAAANIRNRIAGIPSMVDLDLRFRQMDEFGDDYRQVDSLPAPPIEDLGPPPRGREFAQLEAIDHACGELGALGVQIYTHVNGHPLDEERFEPFWARMAELGKPVWEHPSRNGLPHRGRLEVRDLVGVRLGVRHRGVHGEDRLLRRARAPSGPEDPDPPRRQHGPALRGPCRSGLGPARRAHAAGAGARGRARPALQAAAGVLQDVLRGHRHVRSRARHPVLHRVLRGGRILFASDTPFDPEKGPGYIRSTIDNLESLDLSAEDREKIYEGNARRVLGVT